MHNHACKPGAEQPNLRQSGRPATIMPDLDPEACFRMLVENINDIFWIIDSKTGAGIYVSETIETILGIPAHKFYEDPCLVQDLVHPEDRNIYEKLKAQTVAGKEADAYYRLVQGNHLPIWLRTRTSPVFNDAGDLTYIVGIYRDVTTQKTTELELRDSHEHYRQAADSNRQLLHEVNHRVRNNLAGLLSLIHLTRHTTQSLDEYNLMIARRISLMTVAHDMLSNTGWKSVDLHAMLKQIASQSNDNSPQLTALTTQGPCTSIHPRQVMPLILAILELYNLSEYLCTFDDSPSHISLNWSHVTYKHRPAMKLIWEQPVKNLLLNERTPALDEKIILACELVAGFINYELAGNVSINTDARPLRHVITIPIMGDPLADESAFCYAI